MPESYLSDDQLAALSASSNIPSQYRMQVNVWRQQQRIVGNPIPSAPLADSSVPRPTPPPDVDALIEQSLKRAAGINGAFKVQPPPVAAPPPMAGPSTLPQGDPNIAGTPAPGAMAVAPAQENAVPAGTPNPSLTVIVLILAVSSLIVVQAVKAGLLTGELAAEAEVAFARYKAAWKRALEFRKLSRKLTAPQWLRLVSAGMCVLAVAEMPFGYYSVLRWIVTCAAGWGVWLAVEAKNEKWTWILAAIVILFNPLAPVQLDRETWAPVDLLTAFCLLYSVREIRGATSQSARQG